VGLLAHYWLLSSSLDFAGSLPLVGSLAQLTVWILGSLFAGSLALILPNGSLAPWLFAGFLDPWHLADSLVTWLLAGFLAPSWMTFSFLAQ